MANMAGDRTPRKLKPPVAADWTGPLPDLPVFSEATVKDDRGTPHCPQCGGTQFVQRRSMKMKAMLGLSSLLARANEVHCVTCGARFRRD